MKVDVCMVSLAGKSHGDQDIVTYSRIYITLNKIWILIPSSILVVIPSLDTLKFLPVSLSLSCKVKAVSDLPVLQTLKTLKPFAINVYNDVFF